MDPAASAAAGLHEAQMLSIDYNGRRYGAQADETLLDALLRQGADIAFSCRKGSCQCCVVRLLDGEIDPLRQGAAAIGDGHVLCCMSRPRGHVVLAAADAAQRAQPVELLNRIRLSADIFALDLAPHRALPFRAGQHVELIRADGLSRPYSMASDADDAFSFRIHVRRHASDGMSRWLCSDAPIGQTLHLRGPFGACCYHEDMRQRPVLLLATDSGAGMLLGLASDALQRGHRGVIAFFHGAREPAGLYLQDSLHALQQRFANFRHVGIVTPPAPDVNGHRLADAAFPAGADLAACEVFLCGSAKMVEAARVRAIAAGVLRERIHADPFTVAQAQAPRDAIKIAHTDPDPELWAALEHGPGLTRILGAFYLRVYQDSRLLPFFHNVSMERVIYKQYEFLADLFSGRRAYLGLNPFNAHHWMVISDDLFDHRERLFEQVLHEHGLAPALIRRWMALHEWFRSDMVKAVPRGIVSDGMEQPLHTHTVQHLDIDAVCDGCQEEIPAGAASRYHYRVGSLHCAGCAVL